MKLKISENNTKITSADYREHEHLSVLVINANFRPITVNQTMYTGNAYTWYFDDIDNAKTNTVELTIETDYDIGVLSRPVFEQYEKDQLVIIFVKVDLFE